MPSGRWWSPEDEAFIWENWGKVDREIIAATLGRTLCACQLKASKLGISRGQVQRHWSHCEDDFLRQNYQTMPTEHLASHVNHPTGAVLARAKLLMVRKRKPKPTDPAPE